MSPFTKPTPDRRRNWIVVLHDYDGEDRQYGPYTEAAARQAAARVQRWIDANDNPDLFVGCFPLHKWSTLDE